MHSPTNDIFIVFNDRSIHNEECRRQIYRNVTPRSSLLLSASTFSPFYVFPEYCYIAIPVRKIFFRNKEYIFFPYFLSRSIRCRCVSSRALDFSKLNASIAAREDTQRQRIQCFSGHYSYYWYK